MLHNGRPPKLPHVYAPTLRRHLAQSDPHLGSRLLLGCEDEDDEGDGPTAGEAAPGETCEDGAEGGSWFRVASRREASLHAEVRVVAMWAMLTMAILAMAMRAMAMLTMAMAYAV